MDIRPFAPDDVDDVIALWEVCGLTVPWNDPRADIDRKLGEQPELFLVGEIDGALMATAMAGFDGHRGWLYYLGVHPDHRQAGHARELVVTIERLLAARGCPKVNLQVRAENTPALGFYDALGYGREERVSFGKRLSPDA